VPATFRILAELPPERRAELQAVLDALHHADCTVTVLPDGDRHEPPTGLGYRLTVTGPGYHAVARLSVDDSAEQWAASLKALVQRSG
jgi:hypothetical protein